MEAGRLTERFRFEKRAETDDGYGNTVAGDWVAQFTVAAARRFLRGGESVIAARLQARQPAIISVRISSNTVQIGPDWRAIDDRTGEEYAIREKPHYAVRKSGREDRGILEMLAEIGVAA